MPVCSKCGGNSGSCACDKECPYCRSILTLWTPDRYIREAPGYDTILDKEDRILAQTTASYKGYKCNGNVNHHKVYDTIIDVLVLSNGHGYVWIHASEVWKEHWERIYEDFSHLV